MIGAGLFKRAAVSVDGAFRGLQHFRAARRVHGHHPHAKLRCRCDGACNLVWDVVKLEIEKHAVPLLDETPYERGPFGREQSGADFDAAHVPFQAGGELGCVDGVVHIECD